MSHDIDEHDPRRFLRTRYDTPKEPTEDPETATPEDVELYKDDAISEQDENERRESDASGVAGLGYLRLCVQGSWIGCDSEDYDQRQLPEL